MIAGWLSARWRRAGPEAVALGGSSALAYSRRLDGLRGVAISLVLMVHLASPTLPFSSEAWLATRRLVGWVGPTGVDLFFVVSGFLITSILLTCRESPGALRAFYVRRALRILPAYYAFVGLAFLLPLIRRAYPALADPWPTLLFVQNWQLAFNDGAPGWPNNILWSVSIEEQFYLIWPLAVYALSRRSLVRVTLALIVLSVVARVVSWQLIGGSAASFLTFCRLDGLALGALAALGCVPRRLTLVMVASGVAYGLTTAVVMAAIDIGFVGWLLLVAFGKLAISLFYYAVMLKLGGPANAAMVYLGRRCYGLYLFHAPAITFAGFAFPAYRWGVALPIAGLLWTLAAAELSWRLIEAPALSLKRFFPYRAREVGTMPAEAAATAARAAP